MPAPVTSDDFLDHLRESSLIAEPKLGDYVQDLRRTNDLPREPEFLAGRLVRDGLITSFQAQQILQGRYKNFVVGPYKLLHPLGAGGMSKVFLCEHSETGRHLAMKILWYPRAADPVILARFVREARIINGLKHPNIVRAHDFDCRDEKLHYIVMDFVDGVAFDELVKQRTQLVPEHAAHYMAQTACGLQYIHEAGLIHRDVKPGNLLLDREGIVKMLDLGLARIQDDHERLTDQFNSGAILGTADFISPEQTQVGKTVDIRSDIYSLGATFYFLLTGRALFPSRPITEKIRGHQSHAPTPVQHLRPDVPDDMASVLQQMIAKKPADRFQTPKDAAQALLKWFEMDVPPPSDWEVPKFGAQRLNSSHTGYFRPETNAVAATLAAQSAAPAPEKTGKLWLAAGAFIAVLTIAAGLFAIFG